MRNREIQEKRLEWFKSARERGMITLLGVSILSGLLASALRRKPPIEPLKTFFTWWVVGMIAGVFLAYSAIAYFYIGQRWPPPWRYGAVQDVPGQSIYSSREAQEAAALAPVPQERVQRQHVLGGQSEITEKQVLWEFLKKLGDDSGLSDREKRR